MPDLCDEIGCARDNYAALEVVRALKVERDEIKANAERDLQTAMSANDGQ